MTRAPRPYDSPFDDDQPLYEPFDIHRPADAIKDSEVDFDDETEDDQAPLDLVEAMEVGANLDDPEVDPAPDLDD